MRGKLIKIRLVDILKGDISCPNYRSRLVGKGIKTYADDSLYASIPPFEALRLITSRAATHNGAHQQIIMNDGRQAYFYAKAARDVDIEWPKEDPHSARGDLVGKLKFCVYGAREVALTWQETLSQHLIDNGFVRGVGFPGVFVQKEKDIWTLVHEDDYCSTGSSASLSWLDTLLSKR